MVYLQQEGANKPLQFFMFDTILLGAIIVGLTELAKKTIGMTSRYVPLTTLVISAIIFSVFAIFAPVHVDWAFISSAIVVSLTSMGLFSGVKTTLTK